MFSRLRKRLTYTNVAMTLALVFAMTGGAYAASKFVITSTKQIKPSVLKQLQGKAGKAGANGANGAQGPQGTAGAKGENGAPGAEGKQGPKGEEGKEGKAGKNGTTGFTKTLPTGETETGMWALTIGQHEAIFAKYGVGLAPISFNIPLAAALPEASVKIKPVGYDGTDNTGAEHEECPGKASEPKAALGKLCVYKNEDLTSALSETVEVRTRGGVVVAFLSELGEGRPAEGSWAVTAE